MDILRGQRTRPRPPRPLPRTPGQPRPFKTPYGLPGRGHPLPHDPRGTRPRDQPTVWPSILAHGLAALVGLIVGFQAAHLLS